MAIGTTRRKRRLGKLVAGYMDRAGLKVDDVVQAVGTSRPTMFKLLKGDHKPQRVLFIALLGVLTLDETERAELLALYETADVETVEIEHAADLPRNYLRFRRDEGEAEAALTLDPDVIPGLLQTSEYAEALALSARRLIADRSWSDKSRAERLQRSELITRESNPLKLRALIDVAALYRAVGGTDVMRRQCDHLLTMGALPNVEIQAVPFSAGAYCVTNGALVLLSFPLPDDEPMAAYIDAGLAGMFAVQDPEQVQALSAVWDDVAALALSAEQTAEVIREIRDNPK
jgi:uncharacterized protein DUF5753/helix-turn-helix protein